MVAWFLGLEGVLSWVLVEEKCDAITVDINVIAMFRQAIGSSPGRNNGTASPESSMVVDDEVLHKLVSMVEKNEFLRN
ncbi:hypothetical protein Tco_0420788 [Tanacetum coccineum]